MKAFIVRPVEPDRDFARIAAWLSSLEGEPTSESALHADYESHREQSVRFMVAEADGRLLGFCWAFRSKTAPGQVYFYLFVEPQSRRQGLGGSLYDDMLPAVEKAQAKQLQVVVRDTDPQNRLFVERRGFVESRHWIVRTLDLEVFDDQPYDALITRLKEAGFQFTSMQELGDTQEAQRRLYLLNEMTSIETIGSDGTPTWVSFEDFQKSVCQTDWYIPGGQMVVIDTTTGDWAAMSAITRAAGNDYAYNLHTGVDKRYRGRGLAQAVKVFALRYARDVLKAGSVRTQQNSQNLPMIAVNRKLGYIPMSETFLMEKMLE